MPGVSALKVKNAKPGRHDDEAGLYLLVSGSGAKSWMIRVQADGRRRDVGLGSLADVSLEEARDKLVTGQRPILDAFVALAPRS